MVVYKGDIYMCSHSLSKTVLAHTNLFHGERTRGKGGRSEREREKGDGEGEGRWKRVTYKLPVTTQGELHHRTIENNQGAPDFQQNGTAVRLVGQAYKGY